MNKTLAAVLLLAPSFAPAAVLADPAIASPTRSAMNASAFSGAAATPLAVALPAAHAGLFPDNPGELLAQGFAGMANTLRAAREGAAASAPAAKDPQAAALVALPAAKAGIFLDNPGELLAQGFAGMAATLRSAREGAAAPAAAVAAAKARANAANLFAANWRALLEDRPR